MQRLNSRMRQRRKPGRGPRKLRLSMNKPGRGPRKRSISMGKPGRSGRKIGE